MSRADIPVPGLLWGDYPERRPMPARWAERAGAWLHDAAGRALDAGAALRRRPAARWLEQVHAAQAASALLEPAAALQTVRAALQREGLTPAVQVQTLGLVALTAQRCLGLQPFDTQLLAARVVLANRLAEMATGEGKTLAVGLAAAVGALAGMPVHVVTANDYLVARDAQRLKPLYSALGLSVGFVLQADDAAARTRAYACDITYVTAKELVFDYLRDGLAATAGHSDGSGSGSSTPQRRRDAPAAALARLHHRSATPALLRGLCMAIVDEADVSLIDEARVPLILSQRGDAAAAQDHAEQALRFARTLHAGADFVLDGGVMAATLTAHGRMRLERAAGSLAGASASPAWRHRLHREHAVCTALAALHLYLRERHYLVLDAKLQLIDETSGRIAEGRVWSNGLQQMVEVKEGCCASPPMVTLAQLTFQRFFVRYLRLGGLSGTLQEARAELLASYALPVRRVPLRKPCRRMAGAARLYPSHAALWPAVVQRIATLHRSGRPVLVAADSVAEAQTLSEQLFRAGLPHTTLHARNDREEACIVAAAGQRGAITVTTNLSGRGTDIELAPGIAALGGLHVLCCQLNAARRTDRQLAGRAARQGDAGSVETMLSLDHALLTQALPRWLHGALLRCAPALPTTGVRALVRWLQAAQEQQQYEQRRRLTQHDEDTERQLGFGAVFE